MRCEIPNPDDPYNGTCSRKPEWLVQIGSLGYPSNKPVTTREFAVCAMHMLSEAAAAASDYRRVIASYQAVRIEQAESYREVERLRGRIGP